MENVSRRSFVGMAAGMAALAGSSIVVNVAEAEPQEIAPCKDPAGLSDTDMYRTHTDLETIIEQRRAYIDAQGDYTCEDGTVIPAVWVKMRALVDGIGAGVGAVEYTGDESFELYKRLCYGEEELGQFYLNCPLSVRFNALDAAIANGCTEAEAKEKLDRLAWTGAMFHVNIGGVDYYNHQRIYHGIVESSMNLYKPGNVYDGFIDDLLAALGGAGDNRTDFPYYYPMPPSIEVMAEGSGILEYDDIEKLLEHHEIFAVSPCQCRYLVNLCGDSIDDLPDPTDTEACKDFIMADGHHLEKCFTFGEEAAFYIEQGFGRQVDREEMRELMQRQIDEGCIMNSCWTKYSEVICSCDKGCSYNSGVKALDPEHPLFPNNSHYNLEWDGETCIKCGLCADRCPAEAISMTGEDGAPAITGWCFRCGQCALVCPVGARKLANKDPELIPEMPADLLDWNNKDTMWRAEKGIWPYEMAKPAWQA